MNVLDYFSEFLILCAVSVDMESSCGGVVMLNSVAARQRDCTVGLKKSLSSWSSDL